MIRTPSISTLFPYTTLFRSIQLLQGREFTERDRADSPGVVVISEKTARHFWPGENPIGKRLKPGSSGNRRPWLEIDRKSTRLNSSHQIISYAVFCLKKKTRL